MLNKALNHVAWSVMKSFWVLSPFLFYHLRVMGVYNFPYDSIIFGVLCGVSTFVMFMTYESR